MKRREILKYTALLTGATLAAPIALSLGSCKSDAQLGSSYVPQFFSVEDYDLIRKVVDIILPNTDSPAASEVGVHKMIDDMASSVFSGEQKENYTAASQQLLQALNEMEEINGESLLALERRRDIASQGYRTLKQQTVAYYLNTEEVGTKFLNYLPLPGEYNGCIELSEVGGKAWAI